jgi:glutamyl-tRNA reductase
LGVYLYSIDDLRQACDRNKQERQKEFPAALVIIEDEAARFMADLYHRATGPIIQRLKQGWHKPKEDELRRLYNKLPELDERAREEISLAFDRLINKLLHPPLESLRDEARNRGTPHALLDALKRLFQLKD